MPRLLEHRIPPPLIDLGYALLMWGLSVGVPAAQLWPRAGSLAVWGVAVGLALLGAGIALAGVLAFRRARTTVNPLAPQRASQLVVVGIYRRTRNPMYLGMLLVLAGWGVCLGNALAFLALPLFVLTLNRLQIKPEERALRERFGEAYLSYMQRVRRWV